MKYVSIILALVLCSTTVSAEKGFSTPGFSAEESETLLAFDFRDYLSGSKRRAQEVEPGDPELSFVSISNITSASAVITWASKARCVGSLEYGTTQQLGRRVKEDAPDHIHSVRLRGLSDGEIIYYKVHSGSSESKILSFHTAAVGAGLPRVVYGVIPESIESSYPDAMIKLKIIGSSGTSLPLSTPVSLSGMWMLNLGNLKTSTGQPFFWNEDMTAEIKVEGLDERGKPSVLLSYTVRLANAPDGDLSQIHGDGSDAISAGPVRVFSPTKRGEEFGPPEPRERGPSPERQFLDRLLNTGEESLRANMKGHEHPHVIPGWRGGKSMGVSHPPEPASVPQRLHLRGKDVLREILKLREERDDAKELFPDVGQYFPELREKLSRDVVPVPLSTGVNIVSLPVDPYTTVTSYSFLTDVEHAEEVTAWNGELQQFGMSAAWVGGEIIGDDFSFVLGYGYFITMSDSGEVTFEGDPVTELQYVTLYAGLEVVSLLGTSDSITSYTIFEDYFSGSKVCRINPETQGYECAFRAHWDVYGEEFPIEEGTGYWVETEEGGYFPSLPDTLVPSLTIVTPQDGDEIYTKQPYIEIVFGDLQWGPDPGSFSCLVNGEDKTSYFMLDEFGAIWQMSGSEELAESTNTIEASVSDLAGNERYQLSTFNVITTPPPEDEHFVNGYVYHGETFESLEGVAVVVSDITGVIYTDSTGHYVFPTPGLGEYVITMELEHHTNAQRYVLIEDGHGDYFVDDAYLSPKDTVVTRITPEGGVAVNSDASVTVTFPESILLEDIDFIAINEYDQENLACPLPDRWVSLANISCWPDSMPFAEEGKDRFFFLIFHIILRIIFPPATIVHVAPVVPPIPAIPSPPWPDPLPPVPVIGGNTVPVSVPSPRYRRRIPVCTPVIPPPPPPNYPDGPPKIVDELSIPPKWPHGGCNNSGSPTLGDVKLKFGGSTVSHELPSVRSLGVRRTLSFTYASHTVEPKAVVETGIDGIPEGYDLPQYTGAQLNTAGRRFTGISDASRDTTMQRVRFDAKGEEGEYLPTGAYYYNDFLSNFSYSKYASADSFGAPPSETTDVWTDFPVRYRDSRSGNLVLVDNRITSKTGSGWAVNGLQRLYFRPDGDAMVTEGGGASHFYDRVYAVPILDLAVTNIQDDDVTILIGDGESGFGDRQDYPVGNDPRAIVAGDFNGDEILDLAIANNDADDVTVLIGDGEGGFGDRQDYQVGNGPRGIVAGDFNGDEALDLAIANHYDWDVSVLIGDGEGGFGGRLDYSVGAQPWGIACGDFTGDEVLDLVVTNHLGTTVSILIGDGGGGFADHQEYSVGDNYTLGILAGDFDGNETLDLAVTKYFDSSVSVLIGDGEGGFGDRQDYPVGNRPISIVAEDFDGDNVLDLAVANQNDDDVSVLIGDGDGGFSDRQDYPVGHFPSGIVAGDFNGDKVHDLAVANTNDNDVSVLIGDGFGHFGDRQDYPVGIGPWAIAVGNFNGDFYLPGFRSYEADFTTLKVNPDSVSYTRIYPDSSKVLFDSLGLQTATIDRNGNTTTYEYDEQKRLIAVTYPGDMVTTLAYDPDGYLETVTDPADRITHFDHDANGNLMSITDPDGSEWQYEYDENHLLTETIDPKENGTAYEYDDKAYVAKVVGADSSTNNLGASDAENTLNEAIAGGQGTPENPADVVKPDELINQFVNTQGDTTYSLTNAYGRRTQKTDVLGRVHNFGYNEDGYPTVLTRPDLTSVNMSWSDAGQITSYVDNSNSATSTYIYDPAFNKPTMVINAVDDTTRYELDDKGNTIRTINAAGDTTQCFYDERGLLIKTINALGDSTVNYYNNIGNLDSVRNELGYFTRCEYDAAGNMTAMIDPLNNRTEYEYDANGRMILMREPLGNETEYIYDPSLVGGGCCGSNTHNLLLATINPAGDTTKYDYNEMGRQISVTDPLGNISQTEYDEEGRVTKKIDPEGRWISYGYDDVGNLTSQTDSLSRTVTFEYDSRNRRTATIDPYGRRTSYIYDNVGNLIHLVNANGDTTSFDYDLLRRKISETDPLSRTKYFKYNPLGSLDTLITAKGDIITYEYDELSRLVEKQYPVGNVTYQYDAAGSVLEIEDDDSKLVMTYDARGTMLTSTTGNPGNPLDPQPVTTIAYVYDDAGRTINMIDPASDTTYYYYNVNSQLDSLICPDHQLFAFERDIIGRAIELSRPNGTTTDYLYDASSQVTSIVHRNGITLIDSLVYSYNPVGMVESIIDDNNTSSYDYDSLDQVIAANYTDPLQTNEFFTYDSLGNRTSSHLSSSYDYDNANQIEEDDQYTYVFDANGNMIEKEDKSTLDRWEYTYDYENRLVGVEKYDGGVTLSLETGYSYDGLDRRIGKTANGDTTVYVYDGSAILFEYDETDSLLASYVHGPAIDQPLMVTRGDDSYYFHADKLGSIIALTDSSGTVVQTYLYDAFGNIIDIMTGDDISPYTYTGREWDEETGLYYYRARYYDAEVGRFLQVDPVGVQNNTALYAYVSNNPMNWVDPSGEMIGIDLFIRDLLEGDVKDWQYYAGDVTETVVGLVVGKLGVDPGSAYDAGGGGWAADMWRDPGKFFDERTRGIRDFLGGLPRYFSDFPKRVSKELDRIGVTGDTGESSSLSEQQLLERRGEAAQRQWEAQGGTSVSTIKSKPPYLRPLGSNVSLLDEESVGIKCIF